MKILIDADACPRSVLGICKDVGLDCGLEVWTVASFNHNIDSDHHVRVGNAAQEADIKLMNMAQKGDIVVTQDWGLAAMLLSKGAWVISPHGKEYHEQQMDFMLEEREAKARYRRGGGRTPGPKKRAPADDDRFKGVLTAMVWRILNAEPPN